MPSPPDADMDVPFSRKWTRLSSVKDLRRDFERRLLERRTLLYRKNYPITSQEVKYQLIKYQLIAAKTGLVIHADPSGVYHSS